MKHFFTKIFLTVLLLGILAPVGFAQNISNPFTITIDKGTNKATITAVSRVANITGSISVSKAGGYPFVTCTAVFNSSGTAPACSVTGLVRNQVYYAVVQAYDASGNAYKGTQEFKLGTTQTPPVVPTQTSPTPANSNPNPTPTPPVVVTNPAPTVTSPAVTSQAVDPNPVVIDQAAIDADKEGNGLVTCHNTCDFKDFLRLIDNVITFLITVLFIPILIIMFMYAGFKYITAQGNPAKRANLKKMLMHVVLGMILILCSWIIVKSVLGVLLSDFYQDAFQ